MIWSLELGVIKIAMRSIIKPDSKMLDGRKRNLNKHEFPTWNNIYLSGSAMHTEKLSVTVSLIQRERSKQFISLHTYAVGSIYVQ